MPSEVDHSPQNHYAHSWWRAFQNALEILLNNQFISNTPPFSTSPQTQLSTGRQKVSRAGLAEIGFRAILA
jgi:hypothetical protein